METQLISVQSLGYKRHNRIHANRYRCARRNKAVDNIAKEFNKQLALLEYDITAWFSRLTPSKTERILRYKAGSGVLKYQEIDFIAQSESGLKFCELKLKSVYKEDMSKKSSGIKQLETTTEAATPVYRLNGSLAICVDMSFVYEGDDTRSDNDYCSVADLAGKFIKNDTNELIWLDVEDVIDIALAEGWLTSERIADLKEAYDMMNNPMDKLPEVHAIPLNNPFSDLGSILLTACSKKS